MKGEISIVLVEPSHPGNIGAAARAMKVMGLQRLVLVNPTHFPDAQATAMAAGADDLLAGAVVCNSLSTAIKDYQLIFGTSARSRSLSLPVLTPHELGEKVTEAAAQGVNCAIIFGRESSGLSNAELASCHYQVQIPSCAEFSSLNLAAAVQVISYECRLGALANNSSLDNNGAKTLQLAKASEVQHLTERIRFLLASNQFTQDQHHLASIMLKVQHIFGKAQLESAEVAILEGILSIYDRCHDR